MTSTSGDGGAALLDGFRTAFSNQNLLDEGMAVAERFEALSDVDEADPEVDAVARRMAEFMPKGDGASGR